MLLSILEVVANYCVSDLNLKTCVFSDLRDSFNITILLDYYYVFEVLGLSVFNILMCCLDSKLLIILGNLK